MLSVLFPCVLLTVSRLLRYADEFLIFLAVPILVLWLGVLFQRLGETRPVFRILKYLFILFAVVWATLRYNRIVTIPYFDDGFGIGDILFGLYWYGLAILFFTGTVIRFLKKHLSPHLKNIFNPNKYPFE